MNDTIPVHKKYAGLIANLPVLMKAAIMAADDAESTPYRDEFQSLCRTLYHIDPKTFRESSALVKGMSCQISSETKLFLYNPVFIRGLLEDLSKSKTNEDR